MLIGCFLPFVEANVLQGWLHAAQQHPMDAPKRRKEEGGRRKEEEGRRNEWEGGMNGEGMEQEERGRRRKKVHKWRKGEHTCVLVGCFYTRCSRRCSHILEYHEW